MREVKSNHKAFWNVFWGAVWGDVIGSAFEFRRPEKIPTDLSVENVLSHKYGCENTFGYEIGMFTDDTIFMLTAMEAFIEKPTDRIEKDIHMSHMGSYIDYGIWSPDNRCFDLGFATRGSYSNWKMGYNVEPDDDVGGNGFLMKIAPYSYYAWCRGLGDSFIIDSVKMTHGECAVPSAIKMHRFLCDIFEEHICHFEEYRTNNTLRNSMGFCEGTWNIALDAVSNNRNLNDVIVECIKHGYDTDTTAAVAGHLAGGIYGVEQVNIDMIKYNDQIKLLVEEFLNVCSTT